MDFSPYYSIQHVIFGCFLVLIVGEVIYARARHHDKPLYSAKETGANLALGLFFAVVNTGTTALYMAWFTALWLLSPLDIPSIWQDNLPTGVGMALTLAIVFLWTDCSYYWGHRGGHSINVLWASHSVHHSSEEFNYSTAGRLNPLDRVTGFVLNAPLVLAGFNPVVVMAVAVLGPGVSLFFHTQVVRKFPTWIEHTFNTPANHRVHHAAQKQYLDRNMGAILMIWDRMFGTYAEEIEQPRFGLTKPINTANPVRVEVCEWRRMIDSARGASTARDRLVAVFGKPGALEAAPQSGGTVSDCARSFSSV